MQTFLRTEDEYTTVHLADGNLVHVYGDGRVYLFQETTEPVMINLYTLEEVNAV